MTAVTAPELLGRLVHVDTLESLTARIVPGDPLPDWAEEPTPQAQVPTRLTIRDWTPDHVMVTVRAAATRAVDALTGAPAIAVAVVVGAVYEVLGVLPVDADPPRSLLDTLTPQVLDRLARQALLDTGPFVRAALHAASTTVSPAHPLLITGLSAEQIEAFDLGGFADT